MIRNQAKQTLHRVRKGSPVSRQEKIMAMLQENPGDQKLRYMLAMEQRNGDDIEKSLQTFRSLMEDETPYVPAFLMAGQELAKNGKIEDARSTYMAGIEAAVRQGNEHAAGEMTQFRAELG